ncbi:hypothetical protein SPRG_01500 [Saprolegnia parasitica CBS 223.65]|uniref:SnoaL-like domain-containing protein n=1 Tax=Saprolegnia parasitica (strain CBS 223.65) TaxID=695850 RepID=A0A067CUI3_SAPPC|nr:hypothetical protein SPRG_01500 [Saprolegnia parasitica CBS 223.65]KDO34364.1 hypothetical protein SPRG_01500 [Saprolegnia parasitica CBS 223.65]|eukprot:XP_012195100.1 hypothetical protein SPRG_01500 [Saprolegnia parasitica CBS 223.65]
MATSRAKTIGTSAHATVDALLDAFHEAAKVGDLKGYFGCYHKDGRFLGTDASENWHVNDFYDFAKPHFAQGSGWEYRPIAGSRKITYQPSADVPTFCVFDELLVSADFLATSRGSGTLVFANGAWLVLQYHLTFPIPNDLAKDMTAKIATFELRAKDVAAADAAAKLLEEWAIEDDAKAPTKSFKKRSGNKKK